MPDPSATPRRAAAVVGLTALALSLTGSPAFAQDSALPQLATVTDPPATSVVDPVTELLLPSPSPSPSPSSSPSPEPAPVPAPLQPVVDPVVDAVTDLVQNEPAGGQGSQPAPVAAPGGTAPQSAGAPAPVGAPSVAAQSRVGGTGSASLGRLSGFAGGLVAGSGTADVPALGAPMIAAAPSFTLPGLPEPMTAPVTEIASSRPAVPSTPAGLPALVVAVAAVALVATGAGHAAELRARRVSTED